MKNARDILVMAMQSMWLLVLISVSCTTDYRTDEEKANGVVLEQWVIDNRAYARREQLRLEDEAYKEKYWREAYRDCGFENLPTVVCL
jgi:hypothetical protein